MISSEYAVSNRQVAVVLFQLGGPDSLEAVEPFLYNLFSDPDIIDFPFARLARPALARLISSRRAGKVRAHYAGIGGKSPIGELTGLQAAALERELRKTLDARVFVAMRYWHPLTEKAVCEIRAGGFRRIVLLPLYPQYSRTTTGSSLNEWQRRYSAGGGASTGNGAATAVIRSFHNHPAYIDAVVERIEQGLERFRLCGQDGCEGSRFSGSCPDPLPDSEIGNSPPFRGRGLFASLAPEGVHLVFSAHGVPASVIEAGDPYRAQVEDTVRLVVKRGSWPNGYTLCYQSRVGPGRWLEPSLSQTLAGLSAEGVRRVLVVPISFVSDHVETLSEIGMEARELAGRLGIVQFEMTAGLNDSPKFIAALADLVIRQIEGEAGERG